MSTHVSSNALKRTHTAPTLARIREVGPLLQTKIQLAKINPPDVVGRKDADPRKAVAEKEIALCREFGEKEKSLERRAKTVEKLFKMFERGSEELDKPKKELSRVTAEFNLLMAALDRTGGGLAEETEAHTALGGTVVASLRVEHGK